MQTFTPAFIYAARPARHACGDRWFVDETYVKAAGAAQEFFARALRVGPVPVEVTTDRARVYPRLVAELVPAARHVTEQYANNAIEVDHGRLKTRLRPMRGLKTIPSARTVSAGPAFVQNPRRGHYAITADVAPRDRARVAFDELALCL